MQEMQETWVQSLDQEDPLEMEMATHSSILAWEIAWTEEPGRLQPMGLQRLGHDWVSIKAQLGNTEPQCYWHRKDGSSYNLVPESII